MKNITLLKSEVKPNYFKTHKSNKIVKCLTKKVTYDK